MAYIGLFMLVTDMICLNRSLYVECRLISLKYINDKDQVVSGFLDQYVNRYLYGSCLNLNIARIFFDEIHWDQYNFYLINTDFTYKEKLKVYIVYRKPYYILRQVLHGFPQFVFPCLLLSRDDVFGIDNLQISMACFITMFLDLCHSKRCWFNMK